MSDRIAKRLQELSQLQPGWLDGEGAAVSPTCITWTMDVFKNLPVDFPPTYLYPTPDGDIQIEWTIGDWSIQAYTTKLPCLHIDALNTKTDEVIEKIFDCDYIAQLHTLLVGLS